MGSGKKKRVYSCSDERDERGGEIICRCSRAMPVPLLSSHLLFFLEAWEEEGDPGLGTVFLKLGPTVLQPLIAHDAMSRIRVSIHQDQTKRYHLHGERSGASTERQGKPARSQSG